MSWLDGVRHRLRSLVNPRAFEREMQEEMRFHLDLDEMQEHDADRARRRFGNRTYWQEETRRMTWLGHLDGVIQDARYAARSLARSRGLSVMIVLTFALGVGINAATFALLDKVYLRPPSGIEDPSTLRRIWFTSTQVRADGTPFVEYNVPYSWYRAAVDAAGDPRRVGVYATDVEVRIGSGESRRKVQAAIANVAYFTVLGVRPALGRLYTASEDSLGNGSHVVLIGDRLWHEDLGADSAVLGKSIRIDGERYTIVGVLPRGFSGVELQPADLWIPLAAIPQSHWIAKVEGQGPWKDAGPNAFRVIQRVSPSMSDAVFVQRATRSTRDAERRLNHRRPDTTVTVGVASIIAARGPGEQQKELVVGARLGGVAVIILLIACANVVNLLLARGAQRRREIAVRVAVGISRARLVRLLTTEMMLLALVAGGAAVFAAWWGGNVLRSLLLPDIVWNDSALHWRVVAFALVTALAAGLVAGIVPAWQASRPDLSRALKDGTKDGSIHRSRLRNGLVGAQAALTVTLLVGAALFVRSLENVQALHLGYDTRQLLFASLVDGPDSTLTEADADEAMRGIEQRLGGRTGVQRVARALFKPMGAFAFLNFYVGQDSSGSFRRNMPTYSIVSRSYFETVGTRLVRGGVFDDRPGGARQIVVNEAMANELWPARDPIGRCLRFSKRDNPCYTVVGVVENARLTSVIEPDPKPQYYVPLSNMPGGGIAAGTLIARVRPEVLGTAASALVTELRRAFPGREVSVQSMTDALAWQYRPWRLGASLFTAFGLLALVVALVGIYSTVSYGVSQRMHEFGVRVALGAKVSDVLRLVLGEGVRVVALGVVLGIALALAAGRLIATLLYGVRPGDPVVMLSVAAIILVVAAVATLAPAWRAARVDPVTALRAE